MTTTTRPAAGSTYARGTATEKRTTARLSQGSLVLTTPDGQLTASKGGNVWREVERMEAGLTPGWRRSARRYFLIFTDGTRAGGVDGFSPSQTWIVPAVDEDVDEEAEGSFPAAAGLDAEALIAEAHPEVADAPAPAAEESRPSAALSYRRTEHVGVYAVTWRGETETLGTAERIEAHLWRAKVRGGESATVGSQTAAGAWIRERSGQSPAERAAVAVVEEPVPASAPAPEAAPEAEAQERAAWQQLGQARRDRARRQAAEDGSVGGFMVRVMDDTQTGADRHYSVGPFATYTEAAGVAEFQHRARGRGAEVHDRNGDWVDRYTNHASRLLMADAARAEAAEAEPAACGVIAYDGVVSCTLPAGHAGAHRARVLDDGIEAVARWHGTPEPLPAREPDVHAVPIAGARSIVAQVIEGVDAAAEQPPTIEPVLSPAEEVLQLLLGDIDWLEEGPGWRTVEASQRATGEIRGLRRAADLLARALGLAEVYPDALDTAEPAPAAPDLGECQWFAGCERPAAGHVTHPILGEVPTCHRCAEFAERDLH